MLHRLVVAVCVFTLAATAPSLASSAPTFATTLVPATTARFHDAGVAVTQGSTVRISASGTLSYRNGSSHWVGPNGAGNAGTASTTGALVGAFTGPGGRLMSNWLAIGSFATLQAPAGAQRLMLRINGVSGREVGAYRVVADVVPSSLVARIGSGAATGSGYAIGTRGTTQSRYGIGSMQPQTVAMASSGRDVALGIRSHGPGAAPTFPVTTRATSRSDVQYALRRWGFSDTPANVTAIYNNGISNWFSSQLAPPAPPVGVDAAADPNDPALATNVEPLPTGLPKTDGSGNTLDFSQNVEHRLLQWQVATAWQLREKMVMHWMDHFAISYQKIHDNSNSGAMGDMEHYIQVLRYDALGNYGKLLADVSKEPAMMIWLDNGNNVETKSKPPNENFGREIMQLYSIGLWQLNADGTQAISGGLPVATYSEHDVQQIARALTGFTVTFQATQTGNYPSWMDSVGFNSNGHSASGGGNFTLQMGKIPDGTSCTWTPTSYASSGLSSGCVMDNAVSLLANQPTTWAFESKELLQRFVTENPSPGYVSRITAVWGANVNDPHQIAKVIAAIVADPEFMSGKYTVVKDPIELEVDAIRALGGAATNTLANAPLGANNVKDPLFQAVNDTGGNGQQCNPGGMNQEMWCPPSVFSFYYPGDKEGIMNNAELLGRWNAAAHLACGAQLKTPFTGGCGSLSLVFDFTKYNGVKSTHDLAAYLLDALVDGGTPALSALVNNYLNNNPNNVQGALWIILTSPEYEVN